MEIEQFLPRFVVTGQVAMSTLKLRVQIQIGNKEEFFYYEGSETQAAQRSCEYDTTGSVKGQAESNQQYDLVKGVPAHGKGLNQMIFKSNLSNPNYFRTLCKNTFYISKLSISEKGP